MDLLPGSIVLASTELFLINATCREQILKTVLAKYKKDYDYILIDCGPDFRMQMLENKEDSIDAVLLTHEHNDHVIGLDDLRPLIFRNKKDMALYSNKRVGDEVRYRFPYAFTAEKYPGVPSFELHEICDAFSLFDTLIIPIEVMHYKISIFGFKFKNFAYITDASFISEIEKEKLKNLDYFKPKT